MADAPRFDPRRLRPGELCRILNSTPLGEVTSERVLQRHRNRAGLRIDDGTGKGIDLFRYVAWLAMRRERGAKPEPAVPSGLSGYELHRERARQRNAQLSLSGRDIGELPEVADPARKGACRADFRSFCERYFPQTFRLAWSEDHLRVIGRIENAVLEGGLFAMAMPRGSGKTSLCETACLWSLLYGHREFVALIGSDEEHAASMLESIKAELENNDLLLDDFPEVCFPIRSLEGIHQRAGGQLHMGKQTHIGWTAREIVLPSVAGSPASGAVVRVGGITGRIRGMKHKRPDGASIRPSLVLIDDPQTDESARSPSQCANRERILAGAVLGLAGPGRKIAGLMTLTVVRQDDLADRLLDRDKHQEWQGERTRMVYAFPTNQPLWDRYAKVRAEGLRSGSGLRDATAFYLEHRRAMDEGARVAWEARFNYDEASALQHAMNLRLQDEAAFHAEYQNDPLPEATALDDELLTAEAIAAKTSGMARGELPIGTSHLTAFVDVQAKCLFWCVVAWEDDFSGTVVDYGTEPDQKIPAGTAWTLRDVKRTLAAASPRAGLEGSIYAGLELAIEHLVGREWRRDDGAMVRVTRVLVDANWGSSTDVVYQFCRETKHAGTVMPSHGRYVGASSVPFSDYKRRRGERVGLNWRIPTVTGKRAVRHVTFDTNFWKSFVHARLAVPQGDPGSLSLFGRDSRAHEVFAAHLSSEYRVKTEGRGRVVDEWKLRLAGADNHWLDCLVGCAVAASMEGSVLFGTDAKVVARPRVRLSAIRKGGR